MHLMLFSTLHLMILYLWDPFATLKIENPCAVFGQSNTPLNYYIYKDTNDFQKVLHHSATTNVSQKFLTILNCFYYFHLFRLVLSGALFFKLT